MIIAEIGSSHDGSFGNAKKLIEESFKCGANIVKFQLHIPDFEMLKNAPSPKYFKGEDRYTYFKRTNFSLEQLNDLKEHTEKHSMEFMVSPFSEEALDILKKIDVKYLKIASGEVTNHKLLEAISKTGKKVFLSTGMSSWAEIDKALKILKKKTTTIMQCSSIYPCPEENVGLNIILEMQKKYRIPVGFSDHYLGSEAGFAAAALGASVIEKHITFSRRMYGSDAPYAMELSEFADYVKGIRSIWKMNKNPVNKNNLTKYKEMKKVFEKSIIINKKMKKNEIITENDISFKKPGDGISSIHYKKIIGKRLKNNINKDHKLRQKDLC
tara:strand:+ start:38131 stop:39108 length:978 start_codon:yes stop_codon:yes gene_type:complete